MPVTIELREAINGLVVRDGAGTERSYDLVQGLNEVPAEVAEHWYVQKFRVAPKPIPPVFIPAFAIARTDPEPAVTEAAPAEAPASYGHDNDNEPDAA